MTSNRSKGNYDRIRFFLVDKINNLFENELLVFQQGLAV